MITVANAVGKVIEVRLASPIVLDEVVRMGNSLAGILRANPRLMVGCVDLRKAQILGSEMTERVVGMLRKDNPRIERTGFLLSTEAMAFNMQIERLIKEAGSSRRRIFHNTRDFAAWLGEALDATEKARVEQFLLEF